MNKNKGKVNVIHLRLVKYLLLISLSFMGQIYAHAQTIQGIVTDDLNLGFPGVNIILKGTTIGTITDINGAYTIDISKVKNPELEFTFIGFRTLDVKVKNRRKINIKMQPDVAKLDEVVVVGYGTQKRISVTGAVNSINASSLVSPGASIATSLTGKLPGTVIIQNSGTAGASASAIRIRGATSNPLVLVDGVERDFEDLNQDEIKSISVLKDASATAVYGIRGGNGVIIVTTKRGQMGKPKVNFQTKFGLIARGNVLDMLTSAQMAEMYNEGLRNDNGIPLGIDVPGYTDKYSQYDIDMYRSGKDPIMYPSHNWYDEFTNDFGASQRYSLNISGGTKNIRYFTSLSYMYERDAYKSFDVDYDDSSYYSRYNVRSNIDIDLTKTTVFSVDLGGQFANTHSPNCSFGSLTDAMFQTFPNAQTLYDGKIIVVNPDNLNKTPYGTMYDRGYKDNHTNKVQVALKLKQDLGIITQGLSFNMSASYDHTFYNNFTASKAVPYYYASYNTIEGQDGTTYQPWVDPNTGITYNPLTGEVMDNPVKLLRNSTTVSKLSSSRTTGTKLRNLNFKARLQYSRDFGLHHVGGIGVFSLNEKRYNVGSPVYVPFRYMEFAARASYNYANRYFAEFNAGYNGSETFAKEHRFGFFPAASLGWVISNEPLFPKNNVLSFLKVRGSYGTTGIDTSTSRFAYYDAYTQSLSGGYLFGTTPKGQGTYSQTKAGNPDVSWATNYQRNIGVETKWFKNHLNINLDIFKNEKKDIIMLPNSVPSIITAKWAPMNMKQINYQGYEVSAKWEDKIGPVKYYLRGNYNFADAEVIFMDEIEPQYEWQRKTGSHPQQILGLECIGFYSQEDIDAISANNWEGTPENPTSTWAGKKLQAGDLKYVDLNKDGNIDDQDKKYWDNTTIPKTTYGFGGGLTYKKWNFNFFFQGVSDVTYVISGFVKNAFQSGRTSGAAYIMNRWTQERYDAGEKIEFPRMSATISLDSDHNMQNSNFWFRDASYIRLKNASISYKFAPKSLKKLGIQNVLASISGTNLLTFSDLKLVDPESTSGSNAVLPPNKVFTFGLNFNF